MHFLRSAIEGINKDCDESALAVLPGSAMKLIDLSKSAEYLAQMQTSLALFARDFTSWGLSAQRYGSKPPLRLTLQTPPLGRGSFES